MQLETRCNYYFYCCNFYWLLPFWLRTNQAQASVAMTEMYVHILALTVHKSIHFFAMHYLCVVDRAQINDNVWNEMCVEID